MAYKTARNKNPRNQRGNVPIRKAAQQVKAKKKVVAAKGRIADARTKIIQKKRKNVVDARDILAKMAKTKDARGKLLKIREQNKGNPRQQNVNVKVIGKNILRKTDRNGKICLVTNKNKPAAPLGTINETIKQQLGLAQRNPRKLPARKPYDIPAPPIIRKTILNDMPSFGEYGAFRGEEEGLYHWVKPVRPSTIMARRPIARSDDVWRYQVSPQRGSRAYVDLVALEDEEMPMMSARQTISLQGSTRITNVHSRLDSSPPRPSTHGILAAQPKTKVVVPAGHRIVVSNLQTSVTQDDIKELFEDIGQLLVARLVRPGTAEVIYKNLKDAQKAVDTYHNRQLDGQPMKCLLVNKRAYNDPTGPALTTPASEGILSVSRKTNVSSSKLVPDLSTIHKVLFQRK